MKRVCVCVCARARVFVCVHPLRLLGLSFEEKPCVVPTNVIQGLASFSSETFRQHKNHAVSLAKDTEAIPSYPLFQIMVYAALTPTTP